jgi:glycine oxidase
MAGVEVAIIGGGVMGCGLAWCLAQRGVRVAVVERSHIAAEASGVAAGILSAQAEAEAPGPFLELALRSRARFKSWSAALLDETGLDVGYEASGVLMVIAAGATSAETDAELSTLRRRAAWQAERGLRTEWLDEIMLKEAEPALVPAIAALRLVDDGHVDPRRLCAALFQAASRRGTTLWHATVERIEQRGGRVSGLSLIPHSNAGLKTLEADKVVLCAGSWSSAIAGSPLPPDAVQPVHGQIVELDTPAPLLKHVVFGASRGGAHGYLVPRSDGKILIGATMEHNGFIKRSTAGVVQELLGLGTELLPGLLDATFRGAVAGLRPATSDGLPLLGATSLPGLFVCSGHFRNGILLAPASCEALTAQLLEDPDAASVELTAFSPTRFDKAARQD